LSSIAFLRSAEIFAFFHDRSKLPPAGRPANKVEIQMHSARLVRLSLALLFVPFALVACDRFKKGEPDAGPSASATAAPVVSAPAAEVAAADPATTTQPTIVPGTPATPGVVVRVDGGAKPVDAGALALDAGALKLDAGALKLDAGPAPIPTPVPTPKGVPSFPPGFPTTLPTVLPTTMPSLPWPPKK